MIRKTQIYFLLALIGLVSCFDPPEFADEPFIAYDNIRFRPVDGASDSLILSFRFEDGDGDIGLGSEELFPPYHASDFIIDEVNREKVIRRDTSARPVSINRDISLPL